MLGRSEENRLKQFLQKLYLILAVYALNTKAGQAYIHSFSKS